jgi:hypothetical protein
MANKHNRGGKNHLRPTTFPFKERMVKRHAPHRVKRLPKRGNRGGGR